MRSASSLASQALPARPIRAQLQLVHAPSLRRKSLGSTSVIAAAFFTIVLALQIRNSAYQSEFGGYPDEAAHYVSGLMIHDYITAGRLTSMPDFARNYYLHYPKVAIGHWPPVFYAVQAAWTLVFPTSRISLMLFMACLSTLLAVLLYRTVAVELGKVWGAVAGLILIVVPAVQESSRMVMSDVLVALFALLAVLRFARFMETSRKTDAAWFGIFASLTILTKGTGLALAGVPIVALALTNRWKLLLKPAFWLPAAIVGPVCGPWYWLTRHMLQSTGEHPKSALHYIGFALHYYVTHFYRNLGFALLGLSVLGLVAHIVFCRRSTVRAKWATLAAFIVSICLLGCVVPVLPIGGQTQVMGAEERFLVPAMPAMLAFAVSGAQLLGQRVASRFSWGTRAAHAVLIGALIATLVPQAVSRPGQPTFGFAPVAQHVLSQAQMRKAAMLISSDAIGEGMFVAEIAKLDQRPRRYVARGTKVLCNCSWSGEEHKALFPTPEALMGYLGRSPFEIVVYDESVPRQALFEFHQVLAEAVRRYPSRWQLLRTFDITREGVAHSSGIKLYRFLNADPSAPVEVKMERMLNTSLQQKPERE